MRMIAVLIPMSRPALGSRSYNNEERVRIQLVYMYVQPNPSSAELLPSYKVKYKQGYWKTCMGATEGKLKSTQDMQDDLLTYALQQEFRLSYTTRLTHVLNYFRNKL
jgi:hypothetical protein